MGVFWFSSLGVLVLVFFVSDFRFLDVESFKGVFIYLILDYILVNNRRV